MFFRTIFIIRLEKNRNRLKASRSIRSFRYLFVILFYVKMK